jgi:hypothetical protein
MKRNLNKLTVNQVLNGFVKVFYLLLLFVISGCKKYPKNGNDSSKDGQAELEQVPKDVQENEK